MTGSPSESVKKLLEQFATEISGAQEGTDCGLLPSLDLLNVWKTLVDATPGLLSMKELASRAYQRVADRVEEGSFWTRDDIKELEKIQNEWAELMKNLPVDLAASSVVTSPASSAADGEKVEPIYLNWNEAEHLREYITESHEHLVQIEQNLLEWEQHPGKRDLLNAVFRSFHTFKGGAGFLNLKPVRELAHRLETLLDLVRNGRLNFSEEFMGCVLMGKDRLEAFVTEIEMQLNQVKPPSPISIPCHDCFGRIARLIDSADEKSSSNTPVETVSADSSPSSKSRLDLKEKAIIKVDLTKMDDLLDQVGELVVSQGLVMQDARMLEDEAAVLNQNLTHLFRVTKELQKTALSMRMVPIRATFQKMQRVVRDLSQKLNKKVRLEYEGEETELDRTIVEEVSDPLMHMVSNSIAHGIESQEERLKSGKPEEGYVRLKASHRGGSMVVEIEDDGAGLDRDRILSKAREKGLVQAQRNLSDGEIFRLILSPGFSTAEVVTDIAGRGVGMDVVKQNIEKLRGKIDIDSTRGVGTIFTISLPLTLAIIEGLIVISGKRRYILPVTSVLESLPLREDQIRTLHGQGEMIEVRGRWVPVLRLGEYLEGADSVVPLERRVGVVVNADGRERCLLVDDLVGRQEVVIKGLGEMFKDHPLLAGAAIMGNGMIGLILDVPNLVDVPIQTKVEAT